MVHNHLTCQAEGILVFHFDQRVLNRRVSETLTGDVNRGLLHMSFLPFDL